MARPLVYGDGNLLIQCDPFGTIRDLCLPIGEYNHLCGRKIRTGVYVDGRLSWCDIADEWTHSQRYLQHELLIGESTWHNVSLGLELSVTEWLHEGAFVRIIRILNERQPRDVRIFFNEQLHINESDIGDCVTYTPQAHGIVHFKGHVRLLMATDPAPDQFACGMIGFGGFEGTGRDAEDGELGQNSIAQGSVDSTLRVSVHLETGESKDVRFWITPIEYPHLSYSLPSFEIPMAEVGSSESDAFFEHSLKVIRTQTSQTGAIFAANDSDIMETNRANYSYCWPRDGAHIAEVLLDSGDHDAARSYLGFAQRILESHADLPYFFQKYNGNGTLGAGWHPWVKDGQALMPIQQDETASTVSLACKFFGEYSDELSATTLETLIVRPTRFLIDYVDQSGLPLPSFDLWEERYGVHTYTVATVIKALSDCVDLLTKLQRQDLSELRDFALSTCQRMTTALIENLYSESDGRFYRRLAEDGKPDLTIDASTLFVGLLGVLPIDDPKVRSNANSIEKNLWVNSDIGGFARYQGDYYFRKIDHYPGNPWIITTLWIAQDRLMTGDLAGADYLIHWTRKQASTTGILPEQVHPESSEHLSVSPLTWSHAEMVKTLLLQRQVSSPSQ